MGLARKHFQRTMAEQQAVQDNSSQVRPNANQHDLMMAQLHSHIQTLKGVQSISKKCELKSTYLADYQPYIQGVLKADTGQGDDVLMTVMLWSIDAGHYSNALDIGAYAIKHQLTMPDKYQRSTACVIAEEIADAALKSTDEQRVSLDDLSTTFLLLQDTDFPDQVRAKLDKAIGYAYKANHMLNPALEHLKNALQLNPRAGVKKDIAALEKQLKDTPITEANPS
jgi:hypothetical protein